MLSGQLDHPHYIALLGGKEEAYLVCCLRPCWMAGWGCVKVCAHTHVYLCNICVCLCRCGCIYMGVDASRCVRMYVHVCLCMFM